MVLLKSDINFMKRILLLMNNHLLSNIPPKTDQKSLTVTLNYINSYPDELGSLFFYNIIYP